MARRILLALSAVVVLAATTVLAHEGHAHKVMGTVTMVGADHVMLKDTTNKDVTVYVDGKTKVTKDKQTMAMSDVKNGVRVVIMATMTKHNNAERMMATTIELGTAPPAK